MVHQFPVLLAEIGIKDRDRMEGFINLDFFHLLLFLLANPSYQIGDPIPPYLVREGWPGLCPSEFYPRYHKDQEIGSVVTQVEKSRTGRW